MAAGLGRSSREEEVPRGPLCGASPRSRAVLSGRMQQFSGSAASTFGCQANVPAPLAHVHGRWQALLTASTAEETMVQIEKDLPRTMDHELLKEGEVSRGERRRSAPPVRAELRGVRLRRRGPAQGRLKSY